MSAADPRLAAVVALLRPGDVILTSSQAETLRLIVHFQRRFPQFCPLSHSFTHVALYVGDGQVVHSMPDLTLDPCKSGGVAEVPLSDLLTPDVLFAALRADSIVPGLEPVLVECARSWKGLPYGYYQIGYAIAQVLNPSAVQFVQKALNLTALATDERSAARMVARSFVCSDFVHNVYDEVFQDRNPCNSPGGRPAAVTMPCEFFANPRFSDVLDVIAADIPSGTSQPS